MISKKKRVEENLKPKGTTGHVEFKENQNGIKEQCILYTLDLEEGKERIGDQLPLVDISPN